MYKQLLTMADDMMAKGMLGRAAELYRYASPQTAPKQSSVIASIMREKASRTGVGPSDTPFGCMGILPIQRPRFRVFFLVV